MGSGESGLPIDKKIHRGGKVAVVGSSCARLDSRGRLSPHLTPRLAVPAARLLGEFQGYEFCWVGARVG